jgi:type VI secretion system protein ImpG
MDRKLTDYYAQELQHLRDMGQEFAQAFPKIAQRLALDSVPCADPYVERLLEGFALLAARIRCKLEAEYPRFTQALLGTVFPHYLMPTPSMAMVQFHPQLAEAGLAKGWRVPRGSLLRSVPGRGDRTPCQFTTAHDVTLWPLELTEVSYGTREIERLSATPVPGMPPPAEVKAALRVHLRVTAGLPAGALALEALVLHLCDTGNEVPVRLYESLFARSAGIVVSTGTGPRCRRVWLPSAALGPVGFGPDQALLPSDRRVFEGYRLLREYFAFPQRFMFVELSGLREAIGNSQENELDLLFLFRGADPLLERNVGPRNVALHCTPAVNLFSKRADRIHLSNRSAEFHVVVDRTRPIDFEVLQVTEVAGYGSDLADVRTFAPFYAALDSEHDGASGGAYYSLNRVRRTLAENELRGSQRSAYAGSEVYLSLVDRAAAPYRSDLRELAVTGLCSNRDLPLQMTVGVGQTDFGLEVNAPVVSTRCLGRPTAPVASHVEDPQDWRAIGHLSLNYLSLVDGAEHRGATVLRDMLRLYVGPQATDQLKQVDGLLSVESRLVVRRFPRPGPVAFVSGLEVTLTFDEEAFRGSGAFVLSAVLERFLSQYVSINSFTETVLRSADRGEIMRWPPRNGMRPLL